MFQSVFDEFLKSATGVVILFVALSWLSFKFVELWHIAFNRHGLRLQATLARCFGEHPPGRFTNYFYWHPAIVPLSQPPIWNSPRWLRLKAREGAPAAPLMTDPAGRRPGHIAPETFASVMLDPFPWPSTREALSRMLIGNLKRPPSELTAEDSLFVEELADELLERRLEVDAGTSWATFLGAKGGRFDDAFLRTPVDVHASDSQRSDSPLAGLSRAWLGSSLAPNQLRGLILSQLREAEDDVDRFRDSVARWYREAMDRATGRFQRISMFGAFWVALALCLVLNVNMLTIGEGLLGVLGSHSWEDSVVARSKILQAIPSAAFATTAAALHTLAGIFLSAVLIAVGAPFWYDLLGRISRRSGRGPTPRDERS